MSSVFDVAKYILYKRGTMSTWKLQKLCYYAQAWHMAWTEHPIFPEKFEAWANGPVCPKLFHAHKGKFLISEEQLPEGNKDNLSDDEIESVDIILDSYGEKEPYELREMTHLEKPWQIARGGLPENAICQNEITLDSMAEYYGSL